MNLLLAHKAKANGLESPAVLLEEGHPNADAVCPLSFGRVGDTRHQKHHLEVQFSYMRCWIHCWTYFNKFHYLNDYLLFNPSQLQITIKQL